MVDLKYWAGDLGKLINDVNDGSKNKTYSRLPVAPQLLLPVSNNMDLAQKLDVPEDPASAGPFHTDSCVLDSGRWHRYIQEYGFRGSAGRGGKKD